jgi:hypothetical protein
VRSGTRETPDEPSPEEELGGHVLAASGQHPVLRVLLLESPPSMDPWLPEEDLEVEAVLERRECGCFAAGAATSAERP